MGLGRGGVGSEIIPDGLIICDILSGIIQPDEIIENGNILPIWVEMRLVFFFPGLNIKKLRQNQINDSALMYSI